MANAKDIDNLFNKEKNVSKAVKSAVGTVKKTAKAASKAKVAPSGVGGWLMKTGKTLGGLGAGAVTGANWYASNRDLDRANALKSGNFPNSSLYSKSDIDKSEKYYRNLGHNTRIGTAMGATIGGLLGGKQGALYGSSLGGSYGRNLTDAGVALANLLGANWDTENNLIDPYKIAEATTIVKQSPSQQTATTNANQNKQAGNSLNKYSNVRRGGGGMSPEHVNNLVATKGLNAGSEPSDIEVGEAEQLNTTPQSTAMDGILEYMKNRQDKLQPYMDKLNEFVDNYKDYNKGYEDTDIFFRGLAGWTGNPAWATYAKDHNPASTEATQIDLYRKLAEQGLAEDDKYQEILGNIAMAESMGMRPEAAFANPKMISNNIQMQKLQQTLQTRREIANLNAREKELDRQVKVALRQGDWKNAQLLQGMRNEASMKRAVLESSAIGNPTNINNALKALGYDIQLDNTGNGEVSYITKRE